MDTIISKFKSWNRKKKTVAIVVIAIIVLLIFSKFTGGNTPKEKTLVEPDLTAFDTVTNETSEAASDDTAVSETAEQTVTEATTEETTAATTTEKVTEKRTGIDPEFKAFWDGYEKYMDSYVKFMNNPNPSSAEYLKVMSEYQSWLAKIDAYEDDDTLTNEEINYMTAVQLRVSAKLMTVN